MFVFNGPITNKVSLLQPLFKKYKNINSIENIYWFFFSWIFFHNPHQKAVSLEMCPLFVFVLALLLFIAFQVTVILEKAS